MIRAEARLGLATASVSLALVVISSCGNGTGAPSAAASATDAFVERSDRSVITRNDGVPEDSGALPAAPRETGRWEEVSVPTDGLTVYDAARGRVVLFASGQTWLWDGTTWARQAPRSSPPTLSYETMVYDSRRSRTVLFGGRGPYGDQSETWTWDGSDWTKLGPPAAPPARESSMMAYDVARDRVVLFGGSVMRSGTSVSQTSALGDTWTFDGTTWAKAVPASSPPASAYGYLVDDEATGKLVLFGNQDGDQGLAGNATWLWDGATWSEATPNTVPVEQTALTMAYDPATQQVVEIGTSVGTNAYVGYVWNGQTNNWTSLILPTFQPALSNIELAFDRAHGRLVALVAQPGAAGSSTWTWDGTAWTSASPGTAPPARSEASMVYDDRRNQLVLFGGSAPTALGDTWLGDGVSWSLATPASSPPARTGSAMAFDEARGVAVLFGGTTRAPVNETWLWNGSTWTEATPATSPPARFLGMMAYDSAHQNVVLYGGRALGGMTGGLSDTWLWDGTTWTEAAPATKPPSAYNAAMAYDAKSARVVLFGTSANATPVADTWLWDGTTWTQAAPANPPPARIGERAIYDVARGRVVFFGGGESDTWSWDGTDWTNEVTAVAPPPRTFAAFAYDTKNERSVLFGGQSGASGAPTIGDTWLYSMYAGSCASGSECTSGFCTDGVCCDVPSCGTCQTCAGATPGSCAFVGLGADPDTCGGAMSCDVTGACKAANGQMCTSTATCASGNCVDGVCCDTSCDGTCMACTAAGTKAGADGVCGPVAAGSDPRNVCSVDALHPCAGDGTCDGKGSCAITGAMTSCGAVVCDGNRSVGELCDGHGSCSESVSGVDCASYICDRGTGACLLSCASSSDCSTGSSCVAGKCTPSQEGGSCDGDHTVTAPDGKTTDCSPYKCSGSSCQLTCVSITDCSAGTVCDSGGHCVTPSSALLAGGCALGPADRSSSTGSAFGSSAFAALFALSRSLSRRKRTGRGRKVDGGGVRRR